MGLCYVQIKLSTYTIAYDVGPTSYYRRRTLHRPIPCSMMPTASYPNKQQDHIHVQSCSSILIQTNTFHVKTCFSSKSTLQYKWLRIVSYQIAHKLQQKTLKFKISMFLPAKHFTIFIPTAHNKKTIFL